MQKPCLGKYISALLLFLFSYINDKRAADAVLEINM